MPRVPLRSFLSTRFPAVGSTAAGTSVVAGRGLFLVFFSLAAASSLAGALSARGKGTGSLGGPAVKPAAPRVGMADWTQAVVRPAQWAPVEP